jgi:hypothetical protein
MADKDTGKSSWAPWSASTTPEDYPVSASQVSLPSGDFSYILEIVMGMQSTMGKLSEAVETLKVHSKDQGDKVDRLSHIIYGATAVVTVIGGIGLFVLNKIWDLTLIYFKPH